MGPKTADIGNKHRQSIDRRAEPDRALQISVITEVRWLFVIVPNPTRVRYLSGFLSPDCTKNSHMIHITLQGP